MFPWSVFLGRGLLRGALAIVGVRLEALGMVIPLPLPSTPAASAAAAASASPSSSTTTPTSLLAPMVAVVVIIGLVVMLTTDSLCEGVGFHPESTWY